MCRGLEYYGAAAGGGSLLLLDWDIYFQIGLRSDPEDKERDHLYYSKCAWVVRPKSYNSI